MTESVEHTPYGFTWGPVEIQRTAEFEHGNGTYRCIGLMVDGKRVLDIYVSPTGRSVRVFRKGKELA
jgi:hypothetical protein